MSDRNILVLEDAMIECDDIVIASISANSKIADADIPNDIDILVTHYPPYGILDEDMGSTEILNFVLKSRPQWHLFGHIHSTAGQSAMLGYTECRNIG
jgi:Icc-related predicted phosphoesterase